ncbi:cell division protein ZapE [Angustibacter luteus]|uniref:Cell division protein ZapE n=1 Tax=Angustibacter luteus TaxID=658456 RepID=A0ABW1J922_9ACTN
MDELVPPPHFTSVTFDSYRPDPGQPSQAAAVARLRQFADDLGRTGRSGRSGRSLLRRAPRASGPSGIYLDGGFGVGKTHLLAALWHQAPGPKTFGTFVELTHLVGALGFGPAVERLSTRRLVCIDEFELDDPGDTVLMSTLLTRLVQAGVRVAATSNTLPDALGEGRFAAEDFLREIQALSAHFEVLRVDGEDYRHRGLTRAPDPLSENALRGWVGADDTRTYDAFDDLCTHLAAVHPSRYGALVDGVAGVAVAGLHPVSDQNVALRLVVLADRLYDRDVPVAVSGSAVDELFTAELLAGGYRKKYLRALSRLTALARSAAQP